MCNHENRERAMTVVARDHEGVATIWCDPCIAPLIRALNNGGIETIASCCGHGDNDGWVCCADNMLMLLRQVPEGMTPAEFMEGERGGAEVAAAVEAACTFTDDDIENAEHAMGEREWQWFQWLMREKVRASLADSAGALAKHDAEVLRDAADEMIPASPLLIGWDQWLRERADRIEAQP